MKTWIGLAIAMMAGPLHGGALSDALDGLKKRIGMGSLLSTWGPRRKI